MSRAALARCLFALWVVLTAIGLGFAIAQGDLLDAVIAPSLVVIAGVGALIALRRPENLIGWLILAAATLIAFTGAIEGYASSEGGPDSVPGGWLAVWIDSWLFFVWLGLIAFCLPLLFPSGRLPGPRWRWFLLAGAGVAGLAIVGTAFGTPTLEWDNAGEIANPYAIPGAVGDALNSVGTGGELVFALLVLTGVVGLAARLRRARGVERLQLKWFAYAGSLMLVGLAAAGGGEIIGAPSAVGNVGWSLFLLSLSVGMPLAIAVAVLRYRLYDIDLVIRRTLVYGALTATLIGAYLASVLLLQLALSPLTEDSDLAIAGSTLAAAALFRPARARIQALVDRRFYRRKYDAVHTVESFGTRLRDQVELDALSAELREVVGETMQPAHVSLWLREAPR